MIAPDSHTRQRGKKSREVKGWYGVICEEVEGNADYGRMVQPNQQHAVPYVEGIGHERFENSDSVLDWHPGLISLNCRCCGPVGL